MKQSKSLFSAYDFVCLFSAVLHQQNSLTFDYNILVDYIKNKKEMEQYQSILKNITIEKQGNQYFSDDLEAVCNQLKWECILYTFSFEPSATIHIHEMLPSDKFIKAKNKYVPTMENFVTGYHYFEIQADPKTNEGVMTQEPKTRDRVSNAVKSKPKQLVRSKK